MRKRPLSIEHLSLTERVYGSILTNILEGEFKIGQKLACSTISKQLRVSSTPVREAFVALEKEGFIEFVPRKGRYVKGYTTEELKEIYNIREVLEGLAARLAATSPDPDLLAKMRRICEGYRLAIERKDVHLCDQNELLFHRTLAEMGRCKRLVDILKGFHLQSISLLKRGVSYWDYAPTYLKEHLGIFSAVSQRKDALAENRTREHIRKGRDRTFV